jgi:hypothetical protein
VDVGAVACGGRIRCPAAYDTGVVLLALHGATFQSDVRCITFLPSSSEGDNNRRQCDCDCVHTTVRVPWTAQIRFDFLDLVPSLHHRQHLNLNTLPSHLTPTPPPNLTLLPSHPSVSCPNIQSTSSSSINKTLGSHSHAISHFTPKPTLLVRALLPNLLYDN